MAQDQAPIPSDLQEMKQTLAEWRSTQPLRSPLPDSLWLHIIKLARKHGLYRTARSLPIDYGTLKRRCHQDPLGSGSSAGGHAEPASEPAAFVELIGQPATGCMIELVRIEAKGPVDWAQLLEGWRRRSA